MSGSPEYFVRDAMVDRSDGAKLKVKGREDVVC
jgi:hypothetical protein